MFTTVRLLVKAITMFTHYTSMHSKVSWRFSSTTVPDSLQVADSFIIRYQRSPTHCL